jgi:ribulose-phosphate 3-epimerase
MSAIIPAIIPQSFDHLRDAVGLVHACGNEIQIDIVDGKFVPFLSWPYRGSGSVMLLREFTRTMTVEVDLMIEHPEAAIPLYSDAGVQKIVVHLESTSALPAIFAHHAAHTYALGLSIRNDTPLDLLTPYLTEADYIQLMGIRAIGSQGQPFDTVVLDRIRELRERFPAHPISIDGSVNVTTLPLLRDAGASRFVAGSAIFAHEDPEVAFMELDALAHGAIVPHR